MSTEVLLIALALLWLIGCGIAGGLASLKGYRGWGWMLIAGTLGLIATAIFIVLPDRKQAEI